MARVRLSVHVMFLGCLFLGLSPSSHANHDARRLYDDLLRKSGYNPLIRPALNSNSTLTVKMGLRLSQLNDVDERNEIVTSNLWVIHMWTDHSLVWEPEEYGGVDTLYVPSESIWLPDIVLYNNADGDYTVTIMTKATLQANGTVIWEPPAIYKSYCNINVEYFPFDEQECSFKFSSWTYDGTQVDLEHIWLQKLGFTDDTTWIEHAIDLKKYADSVEWDIIAVPAQKNIKYYPCCTLPYPDITFNITIRRKTLSYTVNLIIPCVSINMLTLLTFYLPSDSGEKISLSITILLSLSMFQLLLMESMPATSAAIPLLGKYILFTISMVSLSVFISVLTLNANFRSSSTHEMPEFTKRIFLHVLPRLLFMQKPKEDVEEIEEVEDFEAGQSDLERLQNPYRKKLKHLDTESDVDSIYGNRPMATSNFIGLNSCNVDLSNFCEACAQRRLKTYSPNVAKAIGGVCFVAKHLKGDDESKRIKDEWKYLALVVDRIMLYIYLAICGIGAMAIIMNAPVLFDNRVPLKFGDQEHLQTSEGLGCDGANLAN